MNNMLYSLILSSLITSPTPIELPKTAAPDFMLGATSLQEVVESADAVVICSVKELGESYLEGSAVIPKTKSGFDKLADSARTPVKLTVYASLVGDVPSEITVAIPGGEFERWVVDFGYDELESGWDKFYLLPLREELGDYIPLLDSAARLVDFRDMNGDGVVNFPYDMACLEQYGDCELYAEFPSTYELAEAIDRLVNPRESASEELQKLAAERYSFAEKPTTLEELRDASDRIAVVQISEKSHLSEGAPESLVELFGENCFTRYGGYVSQPIKFDGYRLEFALPGGNQTDYALAELSMYESYLIPFALDGEALVPMLDFAALVNEDSTLSPLGECALYDGLTLAEVAEALAAEVVPTPEPEPEPEVTLESEPKTLSELISAVDELYLCEVNSVGGQLYGAVTSAIKGEKQLLVLESARLKSGRSYLLPFKGGELVTSLAAEVQSDGALTALGVSTLYDGKGLIDLVLELLK